MDLIFTTSGHRSITSNQCRFPQQIELQHIGASPSEALKLFDYVQDVLLWIKDARGEYTWVNTPFLLNYGAEHLEDVIGRSDFDLSGSVLANQYRLDDEQVLKGEPILARVELVGRFDHTARWCLTSKIPLYDAEGRIVGTAGITQQLRGRPPAREDAPLSPAIHYISEHYTEPLPNKKLADLCRMSVRALERHFLVTYRVTPHVYLRHLRVRMSCGPLVFSHKSLAEVANEVGFADQSHFTREFRHFLKETPSTYRARFQRR
jgi:AraC-like DNA-binding protein